jgi:predicted RecB family nuclease
VRTIGNELSLTATDLSNFLGCRHRTALDMALAHGKRKPPPRFEDPLLDILIERGIEHEKRYVESLRAAGRKIVDLSEVPGEKRVQLTLDAMRAGADVIVQGSLSDGQWYGKPDIMQRVDPPSDLGAWSYEISDTKLARETRAGTILQLGLYSEMLRITQGLSPEHFYVVTPDPVSPIHGYRTDDYAAYFRLMRSEMQTMVALDDEVVAALYYPEPVDHCEICPWCGDCKQRWRDDDYLSLVAGITRLQRRELEAQQIATLAGLARLRIPPFKPTRGSIETYVRVHDQASLQLDSRGKPPPPLFELRSCEEGSGLARLPEPSPGDIFLDLEGDPFATEGGREYLFGVVTLDASGNPSYRAFWAFTDHEERAAFESVMDLIANASKAHPGMHVYHYAPYEPSAFKRLMGRYATREKELDTLLRAGRFVDLYGVVRQGLMAGIERYSIKNLEVFYEFQRAVELTDANRCLRLMERDIELNCADDIPREVRDVVEGYNKDDCISTLRLRDWLELRRAELIATRVSVPRPALEPGDASEAVDEKAVRVAALRARLLSGVPETPADQTPEQHARWLLAYLLDWHRREDKAEWWEYFRLRELPEEELFDEPQAVAGLEYVGLVSQVMNARTHRATGSVIDRYKFPAQEMEIRRKAELKFQDGSKWGDVEAVDRDALTIDVRKGPKQAAVHPTAVFAHTFFNSKVQEEALFQLGESIAACGTISEGKTTSGTAARDLLMRRPPRLRSGEFALRPGETAVEFGVRLANDLDETVLAIQGPPGSGKTFTGAKMICALVGQGKKVGVTATGHKVIRKLLDEVEEEAKRSRMSVSLAHKCDDEEEQGSSSGVRLIDNNPDALHALQSRAVSVLGGTAWLWPRDEFIQSVDVLFVDEAGQTSLADVLAVSRAAKSIVLLGDPQQLNQPQKGSHPEGVNASALQHILGEHQTIPPDRGIFLPLTWRLHPNICAFTSELFYENRLRSKAGLEHQHLGGRGEFHGSGLALVEVEHDGNRNSSSEEVEVVASLMARLTARGSIWTDEHGDERQMTLNDVLIVAPYNAQVSRLRERLGVNARVGTVDKFQGQEAPVVIYSATTSRPEDAPRGMEFLYSPNRLNVATSRARCAAILVANPRLFQPDCRTPRQMKLANAFCRYREMAARPDQLERRGPM